MSLPAHFIDEAEEVGNSQLSSTATSTAHEEEGEDVGFDGDEEDLEDLQQEDPPASQGSLVVSDSAPLSQTSTITSEESAAFTDGDSQGTSSATSDGHDDVSTQDTGEVVDPDPVPADGGQAPSPHPSQQGGDEGAPPVGEQDPAYAAGAQLPDPPSPPGSQRSVEQAFIPVFTSGPGSRIVRYLTDSEDEGDVIFVGQAPGAAAVVGQGNVVNVPGHLPAAGGEDHAPALEDGLQVEVGANAVNPAGGVVPGEADEPALLSDCSTLTPVTSEDDL
ncbi:hypothetical protein OC842_002762 [Tilletia horrida]|uniref:Uncharacterized protein n=1 Tax=Tilletia horrida TaxID=155126 RepID=A0AAN6GFB9_9BASI|nr:hypothetical protein OC842_002762 [Tilletia horrida]